MNFNSSVPYEFLAVTLPGHQSLLGKFTGAYREEKSKILDDIITQIVEITGGRLHERSIPTFAALADYTPRAIATVQHTVIAKA